MDLKKVENCLLSHLIRRGLVDESARKSPRSWRVGSSKLGGRGLFAAKDIAVNELVFEDTALVLGPRSVTKHMRLCVGCYRNDCTLFPCDAGCGLPVCSDQCESNPRHKDFECNYLRDLEPDSGSSWSQDLVHAVVPIRALMLSKLDKELVSVLEGHEDGLVIKGSSVTVLYFTLRLLLIVQLIVTII